MQPTAREVLVIVSSYWAATETGLFPWGPFIIKILWIVDLFITAIKEKSKEASLVFMTNIAWLSKERLPEDEHPLGILYFQPPPEVLHLLTVPLSSISWEHSLCN